MGLKHKKGNSFVPLLFKKEMGIRGIVHNVLSSFAIVVLAIACTRTVDDFEVWGLDVSRYQKQVDWEEVLRHEQPYFVLIKATEGSLIVDPTYAKHRTELEKTGVLWGAYHFFGHRTSGKEQARNFIKTARLKRGNIMPVLDIEWHRFMKDPEHSVCEAKSFCREIKRYYGVNPIIYCSTAFYKRYLADTFPENEYILWIADYRECPSLEWKLWQHTDSYTIPGISGKVDRSVFSGTAEEFKKLIL